MERFKDRTSEERRQQIAEKFAILAIERAIQDAYENKYIIIEGERLEDE